MKQRNRKGRASKTQSGRSMIPGGKRASRMNKRIMTQHLMELLQGNPKKVFNPRQLASEMSLHAMGERQLLASVLDGLVMQEVVDEVEPNRYKLNIRTGYVEGVIDRRSNGKTYLVPDDGGSPVFIAERRLRHALNKDRVRVFLYALPAGHEPEGEVVEILKRSQDTFVGVLQVGGNYAFLRVDNKILTNDIFIPIENLHGGKDKQKALVRIVEWGVSDRNPIGEVIDVLGDNGDNNTEMHAILAEYGLPYKYPESLEEEADHIATDLTEEEYARRRDMRSVPTFTIDPRDAKDFDDALSIRRQENGLWEVGVHIADVTHYVKPGTDIDEEAMRRATSVYLVDRTIPMLPEHLCNELCSLRPEEEKLAFSVVFEMDEEANVQHYEICRTVIRSDRRFTYEEAQEIIEGASGDMRAEILQLDALAKKLRERRFRQGAISFESPEVRFEIDANGKPLSVYFKESKDANKLIEEFMLLANRTVATHIGKPGRGQKSKTFVYRVHDTPDPEKLKTFSDFVRKFGYRLKTTGKPADISSSLNELLVQVEGKTESNLVQSVAVRSMAKAIYTTVNIGHYGLAFDYYTHFTSPIRRYPDMMVHRLLERYLQGGRSVDERECEELCEHCSSMEQLAASAERASIKYKQVEYMSSRIGKVFDGVISGITEWGVYVELNENKCEGMIPVRELGDDYYVFDEKNYCLVGKRQHRKFQLGDPITVRVSKTNLEKKQLDFVLAESF